MKKRLDALLVEKGLAESRARAQLLIREGKVRLPYASPVKPSLLVPDGEEITLVEDYPFVSRAGEKLERFLERAEHRFTDQVVLDVGASTGGFTQVALWRGARRVYALDVGRGLLHQRLRSDPRVIAIERTNFRNVERDLLPESVDAVLMDVSFIRVALLLPKVPLFLNNCGHLVLLVKPQFEVGPEKVRKGIVRQSAFVEEAVNRVRGLLEKERFRVVEEAKSALKGRRGNQEVFLLAKLEEEKGMR